MSNFNRWWSANNKYGTALGVTLDDICNRYSIKTIKSLCSFVWSEAANPYLESIDILTKQIEDLCKENRELKRSLKEMADDLL